MSAHHEQRVRDRELLDDLRRVVKVVDPAPVFTTRKHRCSGCGLEETNPDCMCRLPGSDVVA